MFKVEDSVNWFLARSLRSHFGVKCFVAYFSVFVVVEAEDAVTAVGGFG